MILEISLSSIHSPRSMDNFWNSVAALKIACEYPSLLSGIYLKQKCIIKVPNGS